MFAKFIRTTLLGVFVLGSEKAFALPWDTDMYRQQSFQAGEMTRAPVQGTVPLGYKPFRLTVDESESLKNPQPLSLDSAWRGKRLYSVNCQVCHGALGDSQSFVGQQVKAFSLIDDQRKARTDGRIYWVIHNGQGAMPRYGFKLSADEHWDIVNYVRFLQGQEVAGMPRPK